MTYLQAVSAAYVGCTLYHAVNLIFTSYFKSKRFKNKR